MAGICRGSVGGGVEKFCFLKSRQRIRGGLLSKVHGMYFWTLKRRCGEKRGKKTGKEWCDLLLATRLILKGNHGLVGSASSVRGELKF